ncbi:MAG: ABC transporter permease [Prevotella sp.]|nr:ABC transporter permease [Prevotella sp.]
MNTFIRFLSRNKLCTSINVFGLSISLAFVILIAIFTERQMNTDAFQKKGDRIFLLSCFKNEFGYKNAYWLQRYLSERYPEIESGLSLADMKQTVRVDDEMTRETVLLADSAFFNVFTTEVVDGDERQFALSDHHCVISQSYARKMFGSRSAVGKTIALDSEGKEVHTVVAVIKDINNSVLPDAAVIVRGEFLIKPGYNTPNMNDASASYTFLLLKENADLTPKLADMNEYLKELYWPFELYPDDAEVQLHPLRSLYFDEKWGGGEFCSGDAVMMRVLDIVALVLLFFAILNYINLTTSLTTFRAREMATRRLLGTTRCKVVVRLMCETVMMCVISFVVALLLAEMLAPYASEVVNYPLSVFQSMTFKLMAVFMLVVFVAGVISGIIPALIASGYKPIEVMRGKFRSRVNVVYAYLMIGFQYTIVCVMLICTFLFYRQIRGMLEAPLGYNTADMILLENDMPPQQFTALRHKLAQQSWVEKLGQSCGHPHGMLSNNTMQTEDGRTLAFRCVECDSAAYDILGIKQIHGNHIANGNMKENNIRYVYFTESTYAKLGIAKHSAEPVLTGQNPKNKMCLISRGTFSDFHYGSVLEAKQPPIMLSYLEEENIYPWNLLIKTTGSHTENLAHLEKIYKEVTGGLPFDNKAQYVDTIIKKSYQKQHQVLTIVFIFSLIAILVASLGLFAMSMLYIRNRQGSIAIRRIYGTQPSGIVLILLRPFVMVVCLAFVVSCPLAYKLINWWLEDYTFRVPQAWWIYAIVGVAVMCIAVLTIVGLTVKAARSNPVDCLRR